MRDARLQATLDHIWRKNRGSLIDRMVDLATALDSMAVATLTAPDREQALADAHRLQGSLGTFGHRVGSSLAEQAELILQADDIELRENAAALAGALRAYAALVAAD